MNPEKIKSLIPSYIANELKSDEFKMVKDFLDIDPAMRAYAEEMQKTWELLDRVEPIIPSPTYLSDFWTELSKKDDFRTKLAEGFSFQPSRFKWVPVLTSILLLFGLLFYVQISSNQGNNIQLIEMVNLNADDLEMLENFELAENLDIIEDIEILEDMDFLEQWDGSDISHAS